MTEKLEIDGKFPAGHPKLNFDSCARIQCQISVKKNFKETPILLNTA